MTTFVFNQQPEFQKKRKQIFFALAEGYMTDWTKPRTIIGYARIHALVYFPEDPELAAVLHKEAEEAEKDFWGPTCMYEFAEDLELRALAFCAKTPANAEWLKPAQPKPAPVFMNPKIYTGPMRAFCMGTHERLGADSLVKDLPVSVLRKILGR
jgi:hypothetical protein